MLRLFRATLALWLVGTGMGLLAACGHAQPAPAVAAAPRLKDGEYHASLNGIRHWYRVAGAVHGTVPLVIVHGGPGGHVYNFERTIGPELEKFTTLVYYEQRGSGRSMAPASKEDYSIPLLVSDLEALRQELGAPRISLLGFSFGSELALEYALAHRESVDRLILQAPPMGPSERQDFIQLYGFESVSTGELNEQVRSILREPLSSQARLEKVWGVVDSATVDRFLFEDQDVARRNREMWKQSGLVNTGDMARALAKQRNPEPLSLRVRGLDVPALVLVGLHDRNVGVDPARDLARVMPRARLVLFERSAHFPDMEEPGKYAAAVREFLSR
ncbi:MAG: alpha/beta fold hydrolase [Archangium sp.]